MRNLAVLNSSIAAVARAKGAKSFLALSAFAASPLVVLELVEGSARSVTWFGHRWLLTLFFMNDGLPERFHSLSYSQRIITEYFAAWAALLVLAASVFAITWHCMFDANWNAARKTLSSKVANFEDAVLPDSLRDAVQSLFRGTARPLEPFFALWRMVCVAWELPVGVVVGMGILILLGFVLVIAFAGQMISGLIAILIVALILGLLKAAWDAICWDLSELPKIGGITLGLIVGVVVLIWSFMQLPPLLQMNAPALVVSAMVACICLVKGHCGFGSFDITAGDLATAAEELLKNPKESPTAVTRKTVLWA